MKVDVIGSSGTFPTSTNPASGYLISQGATRIWCDVGPGTFTRLPVSNEMVDAIFISHRHPDHCTDIFSAYHAWTFGPEPRSEIPLYANDDVLDHLSAFLGSPRGEAFQPTLDLRELSSGETIVEGDIEFSVVDMSHSVPALGSLWKANGRTFFYTGDTGPGDWEGAPEGVDVFLSEAALQGSRADADFPGHLTASEVGEIARSAGVGKVLLTHIPPHLDATISVSEAEQTFGHPVSLATPGTSFNV